LLALDILSTADDVLTEVIFDHIEVHLKECGALFPFPSPELCIASRKYSENFEQSNLAEILSWTTRVPLSWLQVVYGASRWSWKCLTVLLSFLLSLKAQAAPLSSLHSFALASSFSSLRLSAASGSPRCLTF
jgi:hypothetical protein